MLVADFHVDADFMPLSAVAQIVDGINEIERVDAVAIPGDFIGHDLELMSACAQELGRLNAPTFATLGNHDHYRDAETITTNLRDAGVTVLHNDAVELRSAGEGRPAIWIGGLDSREGKPDADRMTAELPPDAECVVLGHEPDLALEHAELLHLAGHTHHGQIRLRPFRPLYLPRHSRPWYEGLHHIDSERWIYTTAGVGSTTVPLRIGCPPEIVVLDL